MTYIKLLTVLAGLALLTACGGGTAKDPKLAGDGTGGGGGNATNCTTNPFHADCSADATATTLRQTMCLADSTADPSCVGETGVITTFCTANPNHDSSACVAVRCASIPACADGVITYADWLEGFDDTPNTAGDYTRNEPHEFLQGTANGLDTGNISNAIISTAIKTLNLESLGGEAKNGVGWFNSLSGAGGDAVPVRLYSGIFLGTDLGAPLTSADVSVSVPWAGKIGWDFYRSASGLTSTPAPNNNFNLTVDFANSEIRAFVNHGGEVHFLLNAEFDDRGRFEGTIIHGTFAGNDKDATPTSATNGVLTGLIGELGAVGVFISDATQAVSTDTDIAFAGGFVAVPPVVNTGVLPTYPTKPNAETSTRFLTATETGLNITDIQFQGSATRTILNPHFIGRRGLDSDNPDGFAYFVTTSANLNPIGYVGILPTTNLGAPLPSTTANAVWAGHFSVAGSNNIATNYFVDFTNGKFGFSNAAEDDTDGTLTVSTATYTMNAHFGSHNDASSYSAGRMGGTIGISDVATTASATIVGLIGAEGAVGVFTQAVAATGYTGGFTATNPDYTPPTN